MKVDDIVTTIQKMQMFFLDLYFATASLLQTPDSISFKFIFLIEVINCVLIKLVLT